MERKIKKSANESVFKEINLCNPNTILIDKTVDKENQESCSTIIHEPGQTISNQACLFYFKQLYNNEKSNEK